MHGLEQYAIYKLLIALGGGAAALAAIWKVVKWLQGPAAENREKLRELDDKVDALETRTAVIENTLMHIQVSAEITRDEFVGLRKDLSSIRDAILRLGYGTKDEAFLAKGYEATGSK